MINVTFSLRTPNSSLFVAFRLQFPHYIGTLQGPTARTGTQYQDVADLVFSEPVSRLDHRYV